jgi:hypothetical protein
MMIKGHEFERRIAWGPGQGSTEGGKERIHKRQRQKYGTYIHL